MKPESVSTKQERVAKLAAENPAMAFASLNHYLDAEWLRYAYECTRKVDHAKLRELLASFGPRLPPAPIPQRSASGRRSGSQGATSLLK